MRKRSFHIKTLGCKVNQYESQVIRERFLKRGYIEAENIDGADICVVNTCTVTSTSDTKSLRLIRNGVRKKKCVVATGCMVEQDEVGDTFQHRGRKQFPYPRIRGHFPTESVPYLVVRNKDKHRIPEIIDPSSITHHLTPNIGITWLKNHTRAFIKVQDGCDNKCSYCKVRLVRGRSKSRHLHKILNECANLINNGTKEIVLTGICLGAYGRDISKDLNLSKLINELCKLGGDWRIRLSSIEPKDIKDDLIQVLQTQNKLCKHLHIPFQTGDDYILKRMNRHYKNRDYLNIVHRLKDTIPDIAISTDIMVGFPGETETMFQNTLDFISIVRPMRMHIFPYSKRIGTKAYSYIDEVSDIVKKKREERLRFLARGFSKEFVGKFIEKNVEVLVEDRRTSEGYLQGYTDRYIKIFIEGTDSLKGKLYKYCFDRINRILI